MGCIPTAVESRGLVEGSLPAAEEGIEAMLTMGFWDGHFAHSWSCCLSCKTREELCVCPSPLKPDMFYRTGERRSVNDSFLPVKLHFCFIDSEIFFSDHLLLLY